MQRGDLEAAIETLAQVDALPELAREHAFVYDARGNCSTSRAATATRSPSSGRQVFEELGGMNPAVIAWRSQMALAHHQLGETDEAKRLAAEEVELARHWGAPRAMAKALRIAGMVEGGEPGIELLEEAVAPLRRSEAILERARGLLELGSALSRANRRSDAREDLRQALELAHRGEAVTLVARRRKS